MATKVPEQSKSNQVFLAIMSVLSGIQFVGGGIVLIDVIPADVSGILLLVVGAINTGVMYYLNGNIVSLNNVVAYQPSKDNNYALFAGGAATAPTGSELAVEDQVGTLAERYVTDDTPYSNGV